MEYTIQIIEDDLTIATAILEELQAWGYTGEIAIDFSTILEQTKQLNPHLILMDIHLPYHNGFYWCEQIRQISQVPVIFLSSASDNMSMMTAMHQGADDFITKPFELNFLIAKIKALLLRTYEWQEKTKNILLYQSVQLDFDKGNLLSDQGEQIDLTKNELFILRYLFEQRGRIVSRNNLMIQLWESDEFIDENTLTVNISRLRKKLETVGLFNCIKTKKGLGYFIE